MSRLRNLAIKFFFFVSIWLIPSNLFFKFLVSDAYVNGRLVDYLIPKIYALDLVVFGFVIFSLSDQKILKKIKKSLKYSNKILFFLLAILTIRQFFSSHPVVSSLYLLRAGLYVSFGLCVHLQQSKLKKITIPALIFSGLFQLTIAIYQFMFQKPLLAYQWLGESRIDSGLGIAKQTFFGTEQVLAYGTSAHPNILAGIAAFFWLWLLPLTETWSQKNKGWRIGLLTAGLGMVLVIIFMTQSLSALTGLIFALTAWKFRVNLSKKKISWLILAILVIGPIFIYFSSLKWGHPSFSRRSRLDLAGIKLFIKQPIFGTGLAMSTNQIEAVQTSPERVRFVQPPHHALILWLAETGLTGFILGWLLVQHIKFDKKTYPLLIFLATVASLDHYLLTSQSGLILLIISMTLI